jgi:hypothetical protein
MHNDRLPSSWLQLFKGARSLKTCCRQSFQDNGLGRYKQFNVIEEIERWVKLDLSHSSPFELYYRLFYLLHTIIRNRAS